MEILKRLSALLAAYTSPFIILVAVIAMFFPDIFGWVQRGNVASVILGLIMLTMGCTLSTNDFRILIKRPGDIFIGSMAQFTVMPLLAWTLSQVFHLNPFMSAGLILVGCCPGGVSSNIMSFLCRGDVAYSVGMTTASTLLAPFVTPLLVYWLAGTNIEVNVWGMFQNILVVTLIPICIGCAFNYFLGQKAMFQDVQRIMPGMSVICLALIVGGVIYSVHPLLLQNGLGLVLLTLCVVFLHNGLGYLLGFAVGHMCGFSTAKKRTLSIEVGMQNAGMATVLSGNFMATPAMMAVNPLASLSLVPCALSCAYHSISGTLLAGLYLYADRRKAAVGE
ncbi:MAG: bile acid:sodium symporter family protein [Bacteroidaceae bacterium]